MRRRVSPWLYCAFCRSSFKTIYIDVCILVLLGLFNRQPYAVSSVSCPVPSVLRGQFRKQKLLGAYLFFLPFVFQFKRGTASVPVGYFTIGISDIYKYCYFPSIIFFVVNNRYLNLDRTKDAQRYILGIRVYTIIYRVYIYISFFEEYSCVVHVLRTMGTVKTIFTFTYIIFIMISADIYEYWDV